ncbi:MAG: flagellar protein FlgN, partial [Clostridia bacterium]|nr:flagellar protein FlgN [Clostridia bacterium]
AKQPVLVKGDLAALEEFTKQEEKIVVQVGKLEEQRSRVHQALANHFHVPEPEITLSELASKLSTELSGKLSQVGDGLKDILTELKDVNSLNSELVKQSLDYIEFTVNLITSMGETPSYPEKPGESKREQQRARIFDQKV